ncbi:DUF2809 domain-containing protein [Flavobacterium silvisoli]|uniref:DUF2809 domain-containing protein n=1 Tax=Flavobacterium silvisoli TaxID=2529433 RepID=A0A4Q9YTR5_9FLAO|nr:DUF2809 domain-containing protein [Flavobacterium silvisoli]TBX66988.1 DUF2809 domain-containing protein [Flavobacterium silvisoli]
MSVFQFNRKYFGWTVLLFIVEILIASFVHDTIIRPYVGDVLVVILIYCFVRSFLNLKVSTAILLVMVFAFSIETLQYFDLVERLGLKHSKTAHIVLGNSFEYTDFAAYTIGALVVLAVEEAMKKRNL